MLGRLHTAGGGLAGLSPTRLISQACAAAQALSGTTTGRSQLGGSLEWTRSASRVTPETHSTTVLCVRKDGQVVLVADGQVTMGGTVVKPNVRKTRKIGEQAVGGFAGATADAFTLFERLETKLEEHPGGRQQPAPA
jgi:ATP-dependent HslUV protease subunit HslV